MLKNLLTTYDLESGVKKCPNLFRLCGFAIRSKGECFPFCWGITNPPVLIGRTFFTADFKSAGTPDGRRFKSAGNLSDIAFYDVTRNS